MSTYKIEKNVPNFVPRVANKFPLKIMERNDSFLIPSSDYSDPKVMMQRVRSEVYKLKRVSGKADIAFCLKQVEGGIRVWRFL